MNLLRNLKYKNSLSKEKEYKIKKLNKIFKDQKILFLLFNRTLLYAEKINTFSADKEEDIIIDQAKINKRRIIKILKKFYKVKILKDKIQLKERKFKLNISFFNSKEKFFNFRGFLVDINLLLKIKKNKVGRTNFLIPKNSEKVLKKILFPTKIEIFFSSLQNNQLSTLKKFKNGIISLICFLYFRKISTYELSDNIKHIQNLNIFEIMKIFKKKLKRKKIYKINLVKFKNLYFDNNEFNLIFRKKHYAIIGYKKKMEINKILHYLKDKHLAYLKKKIIDTNTSGRFEEPIFFNKKFWQTGNNFFINSLIYGFKKNLQGYEKLNYNNFHNKKIKIYSKKYYESLDNMTDDEIKIFLKDNPLPIRNNSFLSGRHRIAAMIGRLLDKKKYIPFYVYKI